MVGSLVVADVMPCPLGRMLGCDIYSFDFKINHIARHIQLPEAPALGAAARALPLGQQVPPLLVLNIQLPTYPVRCPDAVSLQARQSRLQVAFSRYMHFRWSVLRAPASSVYTCGSVSLWCSA